MNRLLLSGLALVLLAVAAGAVPTGALTAITIDRTAQAEVIADNTTAAVKIGCIDNSGGGGPNYSPVCDYGATGAVLLRLKNGIGGTATGFNPYAWFRIGDSATNTRVLRVTNNSMISVKVWLEDATAKLKMFNQSGAAVDSAATAQGIAPGASHEFYFEVDTSGTSAGNTLTATLKVRQQ